MSCVIPHHGLGKELQMIFPLPYSMQCDCKWILPASAAQKFAYYQMTDLDL